MTVETSLIHLILKVVPSVDNGQKGNGKHDHCKEELKEPHVEGCV